MLFQVTVQATDFGSPALSGNAVLTVSVLRNTQAPVFLTLNPTASVPQTLSVGSSVLLVSAEDGDAQVGFCSRGATANRTASSNDTTTTTTKNSSSCSDMNRANTTKT